MQVLNFIPGGEGTSILHKGTNLLVEEFSQDISEVKGLPLVLRGYLVTGYNVETKTLLSYWTFVINDRAGAKPQPFPGPACHVMTGKVSSNGTLVFSGDFANRVLAAQSQQFNVFYHVQGRRIRLMAITLSPEFRPILERMIEETPLKKPGSVCFPKERCTMGACAIKPRKALGRCP